MFGGFDLQSAALIGGLFVAGFVAVWVFLTLREDEKRNPNGDDSRS
jgi:hypothetical protein